MIRIADLVKPSFWGMVLLGAEIAVIVPTMKFLVNRFAPGTGLAKLVNAI